jgi:ketosteroid isomerase-like protein
VIEQRAKGTAEEIRQFEEQRYAAMLAGDTAVLDKLLDPELVYTHSSGVADSKVSYIEGVRSKIWEYQNIERSDETIILREDVVLVFNRLKISIKVRNVPKQLDNRALAVWTRDAGSGWRLLALHSTPIPQ